MTAKRTVEEWLADPRMAATVAEVRRRVSEVYPLTTYELFTRDDDQLYLVITVGPDDPFDFVGEPIIDLIIDYLQDPRNADLPLAIVTGRVRQHL